MIAPAFHDGELIGFSGNTAHHLDIGGAYPGAAMDLIDMYAEGTIFNATFIVREGVRDDNMWFLFTDNTRVPREVMGDLACQIASAQHGVRRLEGLVEKHSWPVVRAYSDALIDYAERMLRTEIEKIPDGTYHAEGWLDDDGVTRDVPERLHVAGDRRRARTSPSTSPTRRPSGPTR